MQLPLTSVEIFAGGGGMALGMTRAGFEHRALVEWWKPAVDVLRANSSPSTWDQNDILAEDVRKVLPQLSERGVPTLLAGGPPCQPFSLAGASAGHSDARNMFPASLEIVRALRPPLVVFENVPGLLRPSFLPYLEYVQDQLSRPSIEPARADELWFEHHKRIVASRSDREYVVQRLELDAADLGVPQMRKRIFLVAIRSDLLGTAWQGVTLTHSKSALLHDQWISGCYWERHGLVRPRVIPPRLLREVERLRETGRPKLPAWRTLRDLLSVMPRPGKAAAPRGWPDHVAIPGARTYANHTGSAIDMPSKTIKAGVHGVAGGEGMLRGLTGKVRYLSIREAAMAQGFPQSYEFPGVRSRMMGVIGNAVAVDVAAAIGRSLSKQLIG